MLETEGGVAIGSALAVNSALTSLSLSIFCFHKKKTMVPKKHSAGGNNMGPEAAIEISKSLYNNKVLTILNLSNIFLNQKSKKKTKGDNPIGDVGGSKIAESLTVNRTLNTLELGMYPILRQKIDHVEIGDEAAKLFGAALKVNSVLIWLSMSMTFFERKGERKNTLTIENNKIGDAGGIAIGEVVVSSETMLMIDLGIFFFTFA